MEVLRKMVREELRNMVSESFRDKSGDGFNAVDNGVIPGYEEDSKLDSGGYHNVEILLKKPLNLGNNYRVDHFERALKTAYPEDSELMDYLYSELPESDTVTFKFKGNFGDHEEVFSLSDLNL